VLRLDCAPAGGVLTWRRRRSGRTHPGRRLSARRERRVQPVLEVLRRTWEARQILNLDLGT
jgi:hypothetical protein